ncbi:MAG: carboxymuconolactone decarboxylase family protein [Planctomycetes bacterium]|nr:carboxymuconolactone decarboxylase family protein [Planctomycetota bacterium]
MQIDQQLARDGLAPSTRALVGVATSVWRADWPRLDAWATRARELDHRRADVEETLLQCVLFCGFPRVITAWEHFDGAWPPPSPPSGGGLPKPAQLPAGRDLFATIYGENDAPVREMLQRYHGELHDFVLESAYGRILTRPGLDARTRELVAIGVLAAQNQKRQFAGHARGAQHLGADQEELREVLVTAFDGDEQQVELWFARVRT